MVPLRIEQTIEIPAVPMGPFVDHMALDVVGRRLFTTPQADHAVAVIDLQSGRLVHRIAGIGNPHAVLFRADRRRLFVSDGDGALRIYDTVTYRHIRTIALQKDADGIAYDADTGLLYVANGGAGAGKNYTLISIVDTTAERIIGEIRIAAPGLEAMLVDPSTRRLYVNLPDSNAIAVIDLPRRAVIANWGVTLCRRNEAFALDAGGHRLYVGCNDGDVRGSVVVIDTQSGAELKRLAIGSWVDSLSFDVKRRRLYASTGVGELFTYECRDAGEYRELTPVDTAVMARTSLYSEALDRLYVAVPHLGWTLAKVLVFAPQ